MAATILMIAQIYMWIGVAVAVPFLTFGLGRIDKNAQGAWVVRPLLLPGVVLLWPIVLWRWAWLEVGLARPQARYRPPLAPQATLSILLAILIPVSIFTALAIRQNGPFERPSVQVEAPA